MLIKIKDHENIYSGNYEKDGLEWYEDEYINISNRLISMKVKKFIQRGCDTIYETELFLIDDKIKLTFSNDADFGVFKKTMMEACKK